MKHTFLFTAVAAVLVAGIVACKKDGPAEDTGERIDNAAEKIRDTVDPKGPAEKAGEKIDKAINN